MHDNEDRPKTPEEVRREENIRFAFRLAVSTTLHPMHYAKTLIQVHVLLKLNREG